MCANRVVSTRVLPVPAPASTSTGPATLSTAKRCSGVKRARYSVMLRGCGSSPVGYRTRGERGQPDAAVPVLVRPGGGGAAGGRPLRPRADSAVGGGVPGFRDAERDGDDDAGAAAGGPAGDGSAS